MRILVITGIPDKPETTLLCGLARSGYELLVAGEPRDNERRWMEDAGIRVAHFHAKSRFDFKSIKNIKSLVSEFKPDIVYGFTARGVTAMLLATIGKKVKRFAYRGVMGNISRFDPASWLSFLNPKLNAISCVSNAVAGSLAEVGVRQEKLVTIYKGHSPKWYEQGYKRSDRGRFGLESEDFVIFCVANARPGKGVDDVITAVKKLPASIPVKLVLVGDLKDPAIMSLLPDARVVQLGVVPDAFKLIPMADCAVLASKRHEGLPKTVIEAMIQGIPTVVTKVGGMQELVRDQIDGIAVEPGNPGLLTDAFIYLYENPEKRQSLGANARQHIIKDFSPEKTLEQTLQMLRK